MSNSLTRFFARAAKRMKGQALALDDISTVTAVHEPGIMTWHKARRQHNSDYWRVYETHNDLVSGTHDVASGVSLEAAIDKLAEIENEYAGKLRGRKNVPYNHYSKVREMVAAQTPPAAAPASSPVETTSAVKVSAPLRLKLKD